MKLTLEDIAKHVKDLEDANRDLLAACEALVYEADAAYAAGQSYALQSIWARLNTEFRAAIAKAQAVQP